MLATGAVLLPWWPASAHTDLLSSTPGAGSRLDRAPASIRLVFNQDVAPDFVRLSLVKGDGGSPRRLETRVSGPRVVGRVPASLAQEPVDGAGRVHWRAQYRVVSADGHPIEGSLEFTTPNPGLSSAPAPSAAPSAEADPEPAEGVSTVGGTARASGSDAGAPVLSTLVIGALVASVGLGVASWLARARKRGDG